MFQWRSLDPALVGRWLEGLVDRARANADKRTAAAAAAAPTAAAKNRPARRKPSRRRRVW